VSDATKALQKLSAELRHATGKRKLELIFEAPDPRALVRHLPSEDLYFTIQEVGLADAADLVQLAAPEQFRDFVDLDAWSRDGLQPDRVLVWLHAAREPLFEEGADDRFREKLKALDVEVIELVLRREALIHDLHENPDPPLHSDMFWRSPEGKYLIEFTGSATGYARLKQVLEAYYAEDPFQAARFVEAVRWDFPTELEETALRFRNGRLRDLGFPDLDEALEMYRPPPPAAPAPAPAESAAEPRFYLSRYESGLFLDRAAEALAPTGDARDRFQEGLVYVCNCAVVAEGADPSDAEAVRRAVEIARATLSLGLESLAEGDAARGAGLLATLPLKRVFQHGFHLTVQTGHKARPVALEAAPPGGAPLFDPPERHALAGLLLKRPRFFDVEAGALRPFRARVDLLGADATLEACRAATTTMRTLGLDFSRLPELAVACGRDLPSLTYAELLVTACAHLALGRAFAFAPLSREDAPALCAHLDALATALTERTSGLLRERALHRISTELRAPCEAGGLDPKHAPVLLVRAE
jgi:hypothetical protein